MRRSPTRYANLSPRAVADGSHAQVMYFIEDAQADIATLVEDLKAARKWVVHWHSNRLVPSDGAVELLLGRIDLALKENA